MESILSETLGKEGRKARGRATGYRIFLACIVVGIALAIHLWCLGTRIHPRINPLERWEVVFEPADVKPQAVFAMFAYADGLNGGFVAWRTDDDTYLKRGLNAGITIRRWPKKTVVELSDGEEISGALLDDILGFRRELEQVSGDRGIGFGSRRYLIYLRNGDSVGKFYYGTQVRERGDSYPKWIGRFHKIVRELWGEEEGLSY